MMQGVNVDENMLARLEEKLHAYNHVPFNRFLTISVVPGHSRSLNIPNYVSIGPHHGDTSQLRREAEKVSALRQLQRWAENVSPRRQCTRNFLAHLANEVKLVLEEHCIEECYGFNGKERNKAAFVEMMLLDGCYLVANFGNVPNEQPQCQGSLVTGQGSAASNQGNHEIVLGPPGGSSTPPTSSSPTAGRPRSPPPSERSPHSAITTELQPMGSTATRQPLPRHTRVQSSSSSSTTDQHLDRPSSDGEPSRSVLTTYQQPEQNEQTASGSSSRSTPMPSRSIDEEPVQSELLPPSSHRDSFWSDLVRDTWYIVENQMPFVVVEKIYEVTTGRTETDVRDSFTYYAYTLLKSKSYIDSETRQQAGSFFRSLQQLLHSNVMTMLDLLQRLQLFLVSSNRAPPLQPPAGTADAEPSSQGPYHLLDILHTLLKPKSEPDGSKDSEIGRWRRATEYVGYSNVRFVKQNLDGDKARSVLDVAMKGGEVKVPRLRIDGNTWTILHNLMALEQQHPSLGTYVTDYCLFMSQLACTAEDVELLLRHDIIEYSLGDPKNVAAGFGDLCSGVTYDSKVNYLKPIWQKLERRYWSPWHNFCSWFHLNYWSCKNLPVVIALIVAFLVLASEAVGAVFQVLSYYQQEGEHK